MHLGNVKNVRWEWEFSLTPNSHCRKQIWSHFPTCGGLGWVQERELRVGSDTLAITVSNSQFPGLLTQGHGDGTIRYTFSCFASPNSASYGFKKLYNCFGIKLRFLLLLGASREQDSPLDCDREITLYNPCIPILQNYADITGFIFPVLPRHTLRPSPPSLSFQYFVLMKSCEINAGF